MTRVISPGGWLWFVGLLGWIWIPTLTNQRRLVVLQRYLAVGCIQTMDGVGIPPEVPTDLIQCDATSCDNFLATYACGDCHAAYYCSEQCLATHKSEHAEFCQRVVAKEWKNAPETDALDREKGATISIPSNYSGATGDGLNHDVCPICLDDPDAKTAPVITLVACKHVFCLPCLVKWKRHCNSSSSRDPWSVASCEAVEIQSTLVCPTCRCQSHDPEDYLIIKAKNASARGKHPGCPSELKVQLLNEAFLITSALLQVQEPELYPMFVLANVLLALNRPSDAVATTRRLMKLDKERNDAGRSEPVLAWVEHSRDLYNAASSDLASFALHRATQMTMIKANPSLATSFPPSRERTEFYIAIYLLQGEAFLKLAQWPEALRVYRVLMMAQTDAQMSSAGSYEFDYTKFKNHGVVVQIWKGLAVSNYEMGEYETCIEMADRAIAIDRSIAGVHRCKALSLVRQAEQSSAHSLAMLKKAVSAMNQGVLYEAPWDPAVRVSNLELYNSLRGNLVRTQISQG
jgi:tetratricopeptide (TPR) repeat protein